MAENQKDSRRDLLRQYVKALLGDLTATGKVRLADGPDKIAATLLAELQADLRPVLREVGAGAVVGIVKSMSNLLPPSVRKAFNF